MATINSSLESLLPNLLRSLDTRIGVPSVAPPLTDIGTMVTIDISCRKPSRAAAFVHIDTIMIVSEFEWIIVLMRIRSYSRSILLHLLSHARQRYVNSLEEARIVSRPIAVVRIDHNGFFGDAIVPVQHVVDCCVGGLRESGRRTTDRDTDPKRNCPRGDIC